MSDPKKTPLYDDHVKLKAHLVEFASTLLPVRYVSEREEHLAVRSAVGLFDVSHMGEITVKGKDAASFLHHALSNDVHNLVDGQAQYSLLLNEHGGIIDDLIVYRLSAQRYLLCVNAATIEKDLVAIRARASSGTDITIENVSNDYAQLALQGPKAPDLLSSFCSESLPARFFIKPYVIGGIETLLARTGYTGEDGFEIFVAPAQASALWNLLLTHGEKFKIRPCGLAARDSLRLEAGMLLCGQDMDESTSPLEAGLMFAVSLNKGDFIGRNALIEQKRLGAHKKLMGFRMQERGSIPRHGFKLFDHSNREIGVVTSGSLPPHAQAAMGFAYVRRDHARINERVFIDVRGQMKRALLCKPRFLNS